MSKISIVGAGPGAPDLLTRRAENRIVNAEVLMCVIHVIDKANPVVRVSVSHLSLSLS